MLESNLSDTNVILHLLGQPHVSLRVLCGQHVHRITGHALKIEALLLQRHLHNTNTTNVNENKGREREGESKKGPFGV